MVEKQGNREVIKQNLMEELRKNLTKAELERIKQMREFGDIKKGSKSWDLGVTVDPLRMQLRKAKSVVEKSLWQMENLKVKSARINEEVDEDKIRDEVKPGVPMNKDEALLEAKYADWLFEGELQSLPLQLWQIRGVVGQVDVSGKVILTEQEFEEYLGYVHDRVKELGCTLF